jgi:hypothetical protein
MGATLDARQRTSHEVFAKWEDWQKSYYDYSLDQMKNRINDFYWASFHDRFYDYKDHLKPLCHFMHSLTDGGVSEEGDFSESLLGGSCRDNLCTIYQQGEYDFPAFIENLKTHDFCSRELELCDEQAKISDVVERYRLLTKLLWACSNQQDEDSFLLSFGNRCFEYCFSEKTWPLFKTLLQEKENWPLVRFLQANIWHYLVGDGWYKWNANCLATLKRAADQGKELVYIAGGNDILMPLSHGIYTMTVIDPMLPTQTNFYADGWEWLLKGDGKKGGRGDEVTLDCAGKLVTLCRVNYKEQGDFDAKVSTGPVIKLKKSETVWDVRDEHKKTLGKITFVRRFCDKNDFVKNDKRVLLMSFNEMYYMTLPVQNGGWGMPASSLSDDTQVYIKQLRAPINKKTLSFLQEADKSNFRFIKLGSNPT